MFDPFIQLLTFWMEFRVIYSFPKNNKNNDKKIKTKQNIINPPYPEHGRAFS